MQVAAEMPAQQPGASSGSGAASSGEPRRESAKTCGVSGCAQLLVGESHGKDYNRRYRLCQLHLRSAEVQLAGVASRWCQTCSRFQPLAAFAGSKRSCAEQLLALSARRKARTAARRGQRRSAAAAAAAAAAPPSLEEADLLDWLMAGDAAAAPPLAPPQGPAALFADLLNVLSPLVAAPPAEPAAEAPRAVSFTVKLPHATPAHLPPSLAPALAGWADEPLSLFALAQPGCTLLTVDALLHGDAAPAARETLAHALRGCGAAMQGADVAMVGDDLGAVRVPPLAQGALHAGAGATLAVAFAAPVDAAAMRCRAHGVALALTQAGACGVTVALPPGFAHSLLLFDLAQSADEPLRLARPRALLATRDGGIADELADAAAADDEGVTWLLGAALHGASGASDGAPGLLAQAATTAARRGWLHTLAALLSALQELPRDWRRGLLAAAAGGALPHDAVRLLLRAGGAAWPFGAPADGALHAAALACSSRDAGRAAAAAAAALVLTAHGDGALAWHAAAQTLPGGCATGMWTPAQLAVRAGCAPAAALCVALDNRAAAARALLAAAAASLTPSMPPAAAREALLAAALPRLASGAEADAASEQARVADLATAMLADADAMARAFASHAGLYWALRRTAAGVSPARLQLARRLLFSLLCQPALWLMAALLIARRPAASAAEFRAAAAAGDVPLRFWLPSRGLDVAALLRPVAAAFAAACLAPEAAVAALLARSDYVEAALVTFAAAYVLLALQSDALLLPGWREPGQPPVQWDFAASLGQLLMSGATALRARAWAPTPAALAMAARASMLLIAVAIAGHAVPVTRHSGAVVTLQVVALLMLAAARAREAQAMPSRGAHMSRLRPKAT